MSMAQSAGNIARNGVLPYLMAGVVLGGGLGLSLSGWAQAQRVTAAEGAVEQALPPGASIIGSEALDPVTAEVMVDYRGQVIPVRMQQDDAGEWQQDVQATLIRGAEELQLLLAQEESPLPAIGQAPESLLETTTSSTTLISPTDIDQATRDALNRAGRDDPFRPLDEFVPAAPTGIADGPITLPPIDSVPPPPTVSLPTLPDPAPAPITPIATPTPDPAAFARSVDVTGIVQIDGESFAILNAGGQEPAVVQSGDSYRSAQVAQISAQTREVVLTEGGQFVTKPISASVLTEAP